MSGPKYKDPNTSRDLFINILQKEISLDNEIIQKIIKKEPLDDSEIVKAVVFRFNKLSKQHYFKFLPNENGILKLDELLTLGLVSNNNTYFSISIDPGPTNCGIMLYKSELDKEEVLPLKNLNKRILDGAIMEFRPKGEIDAGNQNLIIAFSNFLKALDATGRISKVLVEDQTLSFFKKNRNPDNFVYLPIEAYAMQNACTTIFGNRCRVVSPLAIKSTFSEKFPLSKNPKYQHSKNKESGMIFGCEILPQRLHLLKSDLADAAIIALFDELPECYSKGKIEMSRNDYQNIKKSKIEISLK